MNDFIEAAEYVFSGTYKEFDGPMFDNEVSGRVFCLCLEHLEDGENFSIYTGKQWVYADPVQLATYILIVGESLQ